MQTFASFARLCCCLWHLTASQAYTTILGVLRTRTYEVKLMVTSVRKENKTWYLALVGIVSVLLVCCVEGLRVELSVAGLGQPVTEEG